MDLKRRNDIENRAADLTVSDLIRSANWYRDEHNNNLTSHGVIQAIDAAVSKKALLNKRLVQVSELLEDLYELYYEMNPANEKNEGSAGIETITPKKFLEDAFHPENPEFINQPKCKDGEI